MRLDRFTEKAQEALQNAAQAAQENGQQAVEPEHLLLALAREHEGIARPLLEAAGVSLPGIEAELVSHIERLAKVRGAGQPFISNDLNLVLEQAEREAQRLKDEYISTEHLLLALVERPVLKRAGVTHDALLKALRQVRGSQRVTDPNPESKYQALERYGRDLTALAAGRQARSGDRPRRGDPACHPGAVPSDQEQPGPDRRARCGQDGHCRGPGPAHRRW
jgi:ATP-dependent Clp protease ATP-binding subunit ClpB